MVKDLNRHIKFKNTEFGKVVKNRKKPKTMDKKQLMAIKSTLIGLTVDFETLDYFMFNLNFYAKDYLNEQTIEETKEEGVLLSRLKSRKKLFWHSVRSICILNVLFCNC